MRPTQSQSESQCAFVGNPTQVSIRREPEPAATARFDQCIVRSYENHLRRRIEPISGMKGGDAVIVRDSKLIETGAIRWGSS